MKSYYKKYYDALINKDFKSKTDKYKQALSNSNDKYKAATSIINSSQWLEKGLEIIKNSVLPSLKKQEEQLEQGFGVLDQATSKIKELTSQLKELDNLEKKLESLGGNWIYTPDGDRTEASVNSHNKEITDTEGKISTQEALINSTIMAINQMSFTYKSPKTEFDSVMKELKSHTDIEAKKAQFLGSLDDDSWYVDPAYAHKAKKLLLFDNTTGEILEEGDSINLKAGETRILTVRIPHNAGRVKQVIRTSAGGNKVFLNGHIVKAVSDINPDPNIVERVNYKYGIYWPKDSSILKTNSYDWIITATEPGSVQISQTCEYKVEENQGTPKAMTDIHVNVTA